MGVISKILSLIMLVGFQGNSALANVEINQCNPVVVRDLAEKYAGTLLCSSLEKDHIKPCLNIVLAVGITTYIFGAEAGYRATSLAGNTAAYADMAKSHKYFSPQVRSLINTLKGRAGDSKTIATIIQEMNRHPMIFGKSVINFSQSLRFAKLSRFLKGAGLLTIAGYFLDTVMTPPEDCELLNWENLKEEDKKWITFGMNCSKHINTNFFTLNFEEQMNVTRRSPDICQAIPSFSKDLEELISGLIK